MRVVAIIQARLGSERLPGKVLRDIAGKPMLVRVVNRTMRAATIDEVVIATTEASPDKEIVELSELRDWDCFGGNEYDVLDRYYKAAGQYHADAVVRITSDCPLISSRSNKLSSRVCVILSSNEINRKSDCCREDSVYSKVSQGQESCQVEYQQEFSNYANRARADTR